MKNKKIHQTIIGIDLGDKKHSVCVLGKDGSALREFSLPNRSDDLTRFALDYPGALVAMETGTHSPWISRLLTAQGQEVLVANSRKLRAIYQNERKCDERDASMLAKIARLDRDLLHPVTHVSEKSQTHLFSIKLRDSLVRSRVALIHSLRGTLKSLGILLPAPSTSAFAKIARQRIAEEQPSLETIVEPLLNVLDTLNQQISQTDKRITEIGQTYDVAVRLQTIKGVGPITSLAYVLIIENPDRFKDPRDVAAYLGLVPRRDQSGNTDKQLPISKTGNVYLRSLLVQAAQYILGPFGPDSDLRTHGLKLAARGGKAAKKKAVIAIARKLAVIMLAMWKKGSDYQSHKTPPPATSNVPAAA